MYSRTIVVVEEFDELLFFRREIHRPVRRALQNEKAQHFWRKERRDFARGGAHSTRRAHFGAAHEDEFVWNILRGFFVEDGSQARGRDVASAASGRMGFAGAPVVD